MNRTINIMGAVSLLLAGGCASIQSRVDEANAALRLKERQNAPVVRVESWKQMLELVEASPRLRALGVRKEYATKERDQFYKDMIPNASIVGFFNESLSGLSSVDADSFLLYTNGIVVLPNPIDLRAKYLTNVLTEYATGLEYELSYRDTVAQTYDAVFTLRRVEDSIRKVERLVSLAPAEVESSVSLELARLQAEELQIEARLSNLLGKVANWEIADFDLPSIGANVATIEEGGELIRKVATARVVAMDMSELGVLLTSLPRFSAALSMPSLFRIQNGEAVDNEINADTVRVSAGVFYDLDLTGRKKFNRERLEAMNEIQRASVDADYLSQRSGALRAAELIEKNQAKYDTVKRIATIATGEIAQTAKSFLNHNEHELVAAQLKLLVWNDKFFGE